jgi:hypothetical protein
VSFFTSSFFDIFTAFFILAFFYRFAKLRCTRLELSGELDSATIKEMVKAIELAISKGTDDVRAVEQTKKRLLNSRSVAGAVPMGF